MGKSRTIRLADPTEDRARPEAIAMIAVAAWGIGFVLMLGVARLMPRHSVTEPRTASVARGGLPIDGPEPTRAVSATRGMPTPAAHIVKPAPLAKNTDAPTPADLSPPPAPKPAAAPDRTPIATPMPPVEAKPIDPPPPAAAIAAAPKPPPPSAAVQDTIPKKRAVATKREFSRGVLAYLRCEGSERPHARFPCPRDPKFEESVWDVLGRLPMCDTDPGTGSAEVRFLLRRSQVQDVEWKAGTSGQSLNLRAIGKCAGGKLADLRTRLKAPESLVSFRFSLSDPAATPQ